MEDSLTGLKEVVPHFDDVFSAADSMKELAGWLQVI